MRAPKPVIGNQHRAGAADSGDDAGRRRRCVDLSLTFIPPGPPAIPADATLQGAFTLYTLFPPNPCAPTNGSLRRHPARPDQHRHARQRRHIRHGPPPAQPVPADARRKYAEKRWPLSPELRPVREALAKLNPQPSSTPQPNPYMPATIGKRKRR
jgi:hypothetical protein